MNKGLAAVCVLALAGTVSANDAAVDFDQSIDVAGIFASVRANSQNQGFKVVGVKAASVRHTRECATFEFGPSDSALSKAIAIKSEEWIDECRTDARGDEQCKEYLNRTYKENVQVHIHNRKPLLPWEKETFEACLEGRYLDFDIKAAAYKYTARERNRDGFFILTAGAKTPMDPDPAGIAISLVNRGNSFVINAVDSWADYYAGEQTVVRVRLRRSAFFSDPTLLEKEFVFGSSRNYRVDVANYASELSRALEPGKKYYLEWGFKRIGRVSNPTFVDRGETKKIKFRPAGLSIAAL